MALTEALVADGHAVRAVTRSEAHRAAIEAAGAECWIGDPDVVGTLRYALENVTILVWALGTASGPADAVAALHGSRLEMMLSKSIDTTVRGIVYEAAGTVPAEIAAGRRRRAAAGVRAQRDPVRGADGGSGRRRGWASAARASIDRLLGVGEGHGGCVALGATRSTPDRSAQRDEAHGVERRALEAVRAAAHEDEVLLAAAGDRRDQPPADGELLLQRRRHLAGRRRRDVDRVERRVRGQPGRAVARDDRDVLDAGQRAASATACSASSASSSTP